MIGTLILARSFKRTLTSSAKWFAVAAIVFSALVAVRSSHELTALNIVLSLFFLFLVVSEMIGQPVRGFSIERYAGLGWLPFQFVDHLFPFFGAIFRSRNVVEHHQTAKSVVRGVLLTLPIFAFFALLFTSADLVFQKYARQVISIDLSPEIIVRILLVIVFALGFMGAFWFIFSRLSNRSPQGSSEAIGRSNLVGGIEMKILLGSLNALFLLFLVVQLTYLFGGQENILNQGFTYAEYARRGFFELVVVAVITWLVVWAIDRGLPQAGPAIQRSIRFFGLALVLQVFIIMASAFMRLVLYEQAYGFTTTRFYSHVFVVWLAVVFVLLMVKVFRTHREPALAWSILLSVVGFGLAVNAVNPDRLIAQQNVQRYRSTGVIDPYYLATLAADALPVVVTLLDEPGNLSKVTAHALYADRESLSGEAFAPWQALNFARRSGRQLLDQRAAFLEANKDFEETPNFSTDPGVRP